MTEPNFPDVLAAQIKTLTAKLQECEQRVGACHDHLSDARTARDDVKRDLSRAERAYAALTTTVKRPRKPKHETPLLFAEEAKA